MPKIILNPMIKEMRGTLGGIVYRTLPNGTVYISKRPDMSSVKWSKAQRAQRERMKKANKYAKSAMADPDVRAIYEEMAAKAHRVPYRVALSDYLNGNDLLSRK